MPSASARRARAATKDASSNYLGLTLGVASLVVVAVSISAMVLSSRKDEAGDATSAYEKVEAELNRIDAQWEEFETRLQDGDDKYANLQARLATNSQQEEVALELLKSGDFKKKDLEKRLSTEDEQMDRIAKKLKMQKSTQSSLMAALDSQNELEIRLRREIEELTRQHEDLETALRLAEAKNPGSTTADTPGK